MKKFLVCFFTVLLLVVNTVGIGVYADSDTDILSAIGVMPSDVNGGECLTRQEMCATVVKCMGVGDLLPCETAFADVGEDNIYSGYIHFAQQNKIMSGDENGLFNPESKITGAQFYKILVSILGYGNYAENIGGYPTGYLTVASEIGIDMSAASLEDIKLDMASKIIFDVITREFDEFVYFSVDDSIQKRVGDTQSTLLKKNLNISVVEGVLEKVQPSNNIGFFKVEKEKFVNRKDESLKGSTIKIYGGSTINLTEYLYVPSVMWIDEEGNVLYAELQKDVKLRYSAVKNINGDGDRNHLYSITNVERIVFADESDEEYIISDTAKLIYNGEETSSAVNLAGNFVRCIMRDDEVEVIECFELKSGGLITNVSSDGVISYNCEGTEHKLKDIYDYDIIRVYLNGKARDITEIKPDSTFSYYDGKDFLVIVASEENIIENLDGIVSSSPDKLIIGDSTFDVTELYYSLDGKTYKKKTLSNDLSKLLGNTVCAYIDFRGEIVYIKLYDDVIGNNSFIAVSCGINEDNMAPMTGVIKVMTLKPSITEKMLNITEKTTYGAGCNFNILKDNTEMESKPYKFTVNSKGNVLSVEELVPYSGLDGQNTVTLSSLSSDSSRPNARFGEVLVYFNDENLVGLYEENNTLCATNLEWSKIYSRSCNGSVEISIYGEETEPELVLFKGDVNNIGGIYKKYGIFTVDRSVLDENGDETRVATVITRGTESEAMISESVYKEIGKNAFVLYYDELNYSQKSVVHQTAISLDGSPDTWPIQSMRSAEGLHKATVKKIDEARIFTEEDNVAYFTSPRYNFYALYNENGKDKKFEEATYEDVSVGDTIYYYLDDYEIRGVIIVK